MGEGSGTVPGVSPPIVIPGRGCINRLQDIYSWRGFSIPNILRTMTNKTRAHLENASDIHKLGPEKAEFKRLEYICNLTHP